MIFKKNERKKKEKILKKMMSVQTFPCVFIEYVGVMVVNWRDVERQEDREVIPRKWDTSSFFF